jgi:hypothetical protein
MRRFVKIEGIWTPVGGLRRFARASGIAVICSFTALNSASSRSIATSLSASEHSTPPPG